MSLPLQVAFLTGQSDPGRCALSPEQRAFLDALPVADAGKVRVNFPYDDQTPPYRDVPLVAASWHNARQYLASRAPAFAGRHRRAVLQLIARAECTVLLAGSCGLKLLANLDLSDEMLRRVQVFAYGPVARRRPACDVFVVRGRRDWIARLWGGQAQLLVDAGHMDYLRNAEVLASCRAFVAGCAARGQGGGP
jgi:hypothetical protein